MTVIIIESFGALVLLFLALAINETSGLLSLLIFRVLPALAGLPLAFIAFGRFMGWPV